MNRSLSGHAVKMADPEGGTISWDLEYRGLTDAEMAAFETLFQDCEGRLRPFLFVDPLANLLLWTEDLSQTVWQTGLLVATGISDPIGGSGACRLTNPAQAPQGISQTVASPGAYVYTFSVWVRSESASQVRIALSTGASSLVVAGPTWELATVSGLTEGAEDQLSCSLEVAGACAVEVYGSQLEAQSSASGYRRSRSAGGLYTVRFDQDELERVSHGPENHSTRLRVVTVQE